MNKIDRALDTLNAYGYSISSSFTHKQADKTYIDETTLYFDKIPRAIVQIKNSNQSLNYQADDFGILLDVSRGPVFTVESLKKQICQFALTGYTYVMLYCEDMLSIETQQYGYLKGKYSKEEIKELDEFCNIFEIELIPCIQTLGHFADFLKWDKKGLYKDTNDIIMSNNKATMSLIDEIINFCRECFSSNKIHIGMDEAEGLGRGRYLDEYGYVSPKEIFLKHIDLMYKKFKQHGYQEIIIWSDVPFSLNGDLYLYNNEPNDEMLSKLGEYKDLFLCYWTYGNETVDKQKHIIGNHIRNIDLSKIIIAGGINQWGTISYLTESEKGFSTLVEASGECKLRNIMTTIWFDDGGYNNYNTTLYGIYNRSCSFYGIVEDKIICENIFGLDIKEVKQISEFSDNYKDHVNLLWDNPLTQIYYKTIKCDFNLKEFKKYYIEDEVSIKYDYQKKLINYIINKICIQDMMFDGIEIDTKEIDKIIAQINQLQDSFREYWHEFFKINGMYLILLRFGEQKTMFEEIKKRIEKNVPFNELEECCDVSVSSLYKDAFYHNKI